MSKKNILVTVLTVYVIASIGYIGYRLWDDFRLNYAEQEFQRGRTVTVDQIVQQATTQNCQPFTVFNESQTVELLNTACLQAVPQDDQAMEKTEEQTKTEKANK